MSNIDSIKTLISELIECNLEELCNNQAHGTEKFSDVEPTLINIKTFFSQLSRTDLSTIPDDSLIQIESLAKRVNSNIQNIKSFELKNMNSRNDIINETKNIWKEIFKDLSSVRASIAIMNSDSDENKKIFDQLSKTLQSKHETQESIFNEKINECNIALEETKKLASEAGISVHNESYDQARKNNDQNKKYWFILSIVMIVILLISFGMLSWTVYHFFSLLMSPSLVLSIDQLTAYKIILPLIMSAGGGILISLLYIFKTIFNQYRSYCHRDALYEDNMLALRSFSSIRSAAYDDNIKDAILIGAASLIYSHKPTGFISNDSTDIASIEVLKNAIPISANKQ